MIYEIGRRVKEMRKKEHLSQQQLSAELGLSQGLLSAIENGKSAISLSTVMKVAHFFKISTEWLIHGPIGTNEGNLQKEYMPLIDMDAVAGYVSQPSHPQMLSDRGFYKIPGYTKGTFRLFEVQNDAMFPSLEIHDIAVCEQVSIPGGVEEGMLGVIISSDKMLMQRIFHADSNDQVFILKSDNDHYADQEMTGSEMSEVWRVRSKITNSFIKHPQQNSKRLDKLEKEISEMRSSLGRMERPN